MSSSLSAVEVYMQETNYKITEALNCGWLSERGVLLQQRKSVWIRRRSGEFLERVVC